MKRKQKTTTSTYQCLAFPPELIPVVMPQLRDVGVQIRGQRYSETTVYEALRYFNNSPAAKQIRQLAIQLGAVVTERTQTKFI